jgi:hypothetical protein
MMFHNLCFHHILGYQIIELELAEIVPILGEMRNTHKILFRQISRKWVDTTKMDHDETEHEGVDSIHVRYYEHDNILSDSIKGG